MALQPLSLVHAAYRPPGTNQRLCPGDTAGLPRSRLPPLFNAHMLFGWVCPTGANTSLISSCLPQAVGVVGLPTRTAVSVDPIDIPASVLRRQSGRDISPTRPGWSLSGQIIRVSRQRVGKWDLGDVRSHALDALPGSRQAQGGGKRGENWEGPIRSLYEAHSTNSITLARTCLGTPHPG